MFFFVFCCFFCLLLFCLFAERLSLSTVLLSSSSADISSSSDIENRSLPVSSSVKAEVDSRAFFGDKIRLDGSLLSVLVLLSSVVPSDVDGRVFAAKAMKLGYEKNKNVKHFVSLLSSLEKVS